MAYPQIATYETGFTTSNATSTTITVPSGTQDKDLLILFFSKDGTAAPTTPTGWNLLGEGSSGASYFSIFYRKLTGSISDFTVTHASEQTGWVIVRIPLGDTPVINTIATGTSIAPNSGVLTSGFTAGTETLYLSASGWDSNDNLSGYPSGMNLYNYAANNTSSQGAGAAIAGAESTASAFDPAAFSLSGSEEWAAFTLAVKLIPITEKNLTATLNTSSSLQTSVLYVGYYIERKIDEGPWELLTYDNASPYVDYDIDPGSTYCYRVRYWDGSEYSVYSNEDCEIYPSGGSTPKVLSASVAFVGSIRSQTNKMMIHAVDILGAILKATIRSIAGYAGATGRTIRHTGRIITGNLNAAFSVVRTKIVLKNIAAALSSTITVNRTSLRIFITWINLSGAVLKWTDLHKRPIINSAPIVNRLSDKFNFTALRVSADTIITNIKMAVSSIMPAPVATRDFTAGTLEKILNVSIKVTANTFESILKTINGNAQILDSILKSLRKGLTKNIDISAVIIKVNRVMKIAKTMTYVSACRGTLKTFNAAIWSAAISSRKTARWLIAPNLFSSLTAKNSTFAKTINDILSVTGKVIRQTSNWLNRSIFATSTTTPIKVALKTLISKFSLKGAVQNAIIRAIVVVLSFSAAMQKTIGLSISLSVELLGMVRKQSEKIIGASIRILSNIAHSAVMLRMITTAIHATAILRRITFTVVYSLLSTFSWIQRQIKKTLTVVAFITAQMTRTILCEIRSDIDAVTSMFRFTARDVMTAVSVVATGSDIHKIVVMVYYKTVLAAISVLTTINRSVGWILLAFTNAICSRNTAQSHAKIGERAVSLSTTKRVILLSITDQEGGLLSLAYTGDTIRLYGRFYDWTNVLADVTSPAIVIYDGKGSQITTGIPIKETTGVYYYEYLIPFGYSDPLVYEMSGTLEGTTILARATIERRWV